MREKKREREQMGKERKENGEGGRKKERKKEGHAISTYC